MLQAKNTPNFTCGNICSQSVCSLLSKLIVPSFLCASPSCVLWMWKEARKKMQNEKGGKRNTFSSRDFSLPTVCEASCERFGAVNGGWVSRLLGLLPVFQQSVSALVWLPGSQMWAAAVCNVSVLRLSVALCQNTNSQEITLQLLTDRNSDSVQRGKNGNSCGLGEANV